MNENHEFEGRLALVALPWAQKDIPSGALAALSAYIRRERPEWDVTCHHSFVHFAGRIGFPLYDALADRAYQGGELLNLSLLYPGNSAALRQRFQEWAAEKLNPELIRSLEARDWGDVFDFVRASLEDYVNETVDAVSTGADVVGLTTCFGQLFINLAFAERVKRRAPQIRIVLGGSTVSSRVGPSLLAEYRFIDHIVQGEGEGPLTALLDMFQNHPVAVLKMDGVLSRAADGAPCVPATLSEARNLDDMPYSNYDEYAVLAEEYGIGWALPIEGSRGCWWDRTKRAGNPKSTCYFCNLNVQWKGYRQKSVPRLMAEIDELSRRHRNLRLYFLDNVMRAKGTQEFAEALAEQRRDYHIFYEVRANIRPYEVLLLWEAGLRNVQFGIEGLSTSLLKRIGKGTTTIQNLQAMRLCSELGIEHAANLLSDFPGSTTEEVEETVRNVLDYAMSFQPLNVVKFQLGVDSTVDTLRAGFGLTRVRNKELYRAGLPDDVWRRLLLFDLDFDQEGEVADWTPVKEACDAWYAKYSRRESIPLFYQDGGDFLNIIDDRYEARKEGTLEGGAREIYLYCMEIRSLSQIRRRFDMPEDELLETLQQFVDDHIMFAEQESYLSLAIAPNPLTAVRRIRASYQDERNIESSRRPELTVLAG